MVKALITGATGQVGSYLCDILLGRNYKVIGVKRRSSTNTEERIKHLRQNPNFHLVEGDITDSFSMNSLFCEHSPDFCFNTAAQSVTEDSLIPIRTHGRIIYVTFKDLWNNQVKKNKFYIDGNNIEIIDVNDSRPLYALGYWNGMGTWFKIKQISRHKWNDKVVRLTQKFGQITVTPNHSILDANQKICHVNDNPWLLCVRKFNNEVHRKHDSVKLDSLNGHNFNIKRDEEYFWLEQGGQQGKTRCFLKGESLAAFCRFVGAFVSEGWTSHNKINNSYHVGICQQDKKWLEELEQDIDHFYIGTKCYIRGKKEGYKDVWRLELKSKALYEIMRKLCGTKSNDKKLPNWFTNLKKEYIQEIWQKLLEGDGYISPGGWTYKTTSYKLSCQLSWLFTYLGYDYSVGFEENKQNDNWNSAWNFKQCQSYVIHPNANSKKIEYLDYNGYVYDITVDEVSNFAVGIGNIVVHNSHVHSSFEQPFLTLQTNIMGTLNILEAIKKFSPHTKMLQYSSSEQFGSNYTEKDGQKYQDENTVFSPNSPYAISKVAGHHLVDLYRRSYGLFACSVINFNNESERRGENFVTRKITQWVAHFEKWRISSIENNFSFDEQNIKREGDVFPKLRLGNIESSRDWGYSRDFCEAAILILEQNIPKDYVVCTGETHTIKEFLSEAFSYIGIEDWSSYVYIDPEFYRPCEVPYLRGSFAKINRELGWSPTISFKQLVKIMVQSDLKKVVGNIYV